MATNKLHLTDFLLKNIENEIPLVLLKEKSYILDSFVRGFHVYMDIWDPKVGDGDILLEPEETNEHDEFTLAVLSEGRTVGHVPRNFSKTMKLFMRLPGCSILCKVTGKRVNRGAGYGLEIPVSYKFVGADKAVDWVEEKIKKISEIVR